jgi:PAT family beta-lactamase induction signal transducer AmpG
MIALSEHEQSLYVGIRSTFYRVATVAGQGLLVILAGLIETNTGLAPAQITVTADPSIEWSAAKFSNDFVADNSAEQEMFVYDTPKINASTKAPDRVSININGVDSIIDFRSYTALMRDSVKHLNEQNGFVKAEANNSSFATVAKSEEEGGFTQWVRNTFGEKRAEAQVRNNNIAVAGIRLNKKLDAGESYILNVTYKSGDQSIKLEQDKLSTRFEFNETNCDKTAYLFFEIDNKLSNRTSATFEGASGNIPFAWLVVFVTLSVFFFAVAIYHSRALPRPELQNHEVEKASASDILKEFIETFKSFFKKKQIFVALAFMLLYRLPEAQLVKLINPFLLDPIDKGGLGLTTGEVGIVYGTVGIIGLTIGGIIGGMVAAKGGLKKWLWPMAWSMSLTCLAFVYLSYVQDHSLLTINICVFIEQFGYGFGFTAYMLYLIYFSEGKHKTAHYAICTGFMALGMMLPGMAAGWLQETIGYRHFFVWTMICCAATIGVCAFLKIDPNFGKKRD